MVISPPYISTAYVAELTSVVRCGSSVGGSDPSRRNVPPSTNFPLVEERTEGTTVLSGAGVGVDTDPMEP